MVASNQIMMNAYENLEGFEKIQTYSMFTDNTTDILFLIGGTKAIEDAKDYLFFTNKSPK